MPTTVLAPTTVMIEPLAMPLVPAEKTGVPLPQTMVVEVPLTSVVKLGVMLSQVPLTSPPISSVAPMLAPLISQY